MHKPKAETLVIFVYVLSVILLFFYSFTQVDLNLTLSANPLYQALQKPLLHLGYYQRPLSALVFLLLISSLFVCQLFFLRFIRRRRLGQKTLFKLIVFTALILIFSYPAFSHDLFNYIFDARLLVTHRVNPWQFTALDFPEDLWTRFMHWTHRTYPYGPVWLLLTLPFYLLGVGKFSLTLLLFKAIGAIAYLAGCYLIYRILEKQAPDQRLTGLALFALNPLVISEGLVNAHLDIVMAALLLFAIYLINQKRNLSGWLILVTSALTKFVSAAALPALIWWRGEPKRFNRAMAAGLALIGLATLGLMLLREPLAWYWVTPLAIAALLPRYHRLQIIGIAASLGLLLRYTPFLYFGEYSQKVTLLRNLLTLFPFGLIAFFGTLRTFQTNHH